MQPVSQAWINNQRKTLVSQSFVEISMKVGDPEAQAGAEITTNGQEPIANPEDLLDHTAAPVKYASLVSIISMVIGLIGGGKFSITNLVLNLLVPGLYIYGAMQMKMPV